jgi:lipid-A-disaccharide synthase
MADRFPDHRFMVAAAASLPMEQYNRALGGKAVEVVQGLTYDLLRHARAALVTSGTATLETALFGVPQVVCYRGNALNVWLARRLVDVKYISLVNLVMYRELVTELVQSDLRPDRLEAELRAILHDGPERTHMLEGLAELRHMLGGPGASAKTASALWKSLH